MIKYCKVILHNSAALVVDFDGVLVQLPYIKDVSGGVYVKYQNGKYTVSSVEEYENSLRENKKRKGNASPFGAVSDEDLKTEISKLFKIKYCS